MHHHISKRRKRAQLAFVYSLMVIAVIATVAVLVLVLQGYRFNRYDGKVEQGGLVQFDSRPSGAAVAIDGMQLANRTASKITLSAGSHTVTMSRDRYTTWTKTVNVKAGSVLWLNYSRLFPTSPTVTTQASYDAFAGALVSPDRKQIAVLGAPTIATIYVTPLEDDKPTTRKVVVTASSVTAATDAATVSFSLVAWDHDNRYVIVKHSFDNTAEYLSVDTQNGVAKNITKMLGASISRIEYVLGDSSAVYLLNSDHQVRRGDLNASTLSSPLLTNVSDFAQADRSMLTYETLLSTAGSRSMGYLTNGASTPRVVRVMTDDGAPTLKFRAGTYYGDHFFVISYGDTTTIYDADVPSSDASTEPKLTRVASLTTTGGVKYLGFSPTENRFVYAQQAASAVTYDLEVGTSSTVKFQGDVSRELDWVDQFHIGSTSSNVGYFYDFDGTNGQLVASSVTDAPMAISNNGKYMYYIAPSTTKVDLKRIQLIY